MKTVFQRLIVLIVFGCCAADPLVRYQPEQIHLSLGGKYRNLLISNNNYYYQIEQETRITVSETEHCRSHQKKYTDIGTVRLEKLKHITLYSAVKNFLEKLTMRWEHIGNTSIG